MPFELFLQKLAEFGHGSKTVNNESKLLKAGADLGQVQDASQTQSDAVDQTFVGIDPEQLAIVMQKIQDLKDEEARRLSRPARGGRRPEKLDVDTESLRKDWIGETSQKAFARFGRTSEDTLQRVLKTGKATQKTLNAINRAGKVKHLKLDVQSLIKNPPQKPQ